MPVIDADCHVIESERTWDFMDESESRFRPETMVFASAPERKRFMLIDGALKSALAGAGQVPALRGDLSGLARVSEASRYMLDIDARLRDMDDLGVDVQVLYPTLYLNQVTSRPEVDVALCRSYNRWLADAWKRSSSRLRWIAVLPLLDMDAALDQLRAAREGGACGVFTRVSRGIEF